MGTPLRPAVTPPTSGGAASAPTTAPTPTPAVSPTAAPARAARATTSRKAAANTMETHLHTVSRATAPEFTLEPVGYTKNGAVSAAPGKWYSSPWGAAIAIVSILVVAFFLWRVTADKTPVQPVANVKCLDGAMVMQSSDCDLHDKVYRADQQRIQDLQRQADNARAAEERRVRDLEEQARTVERQRQDQIRADRERADKLEAEKREAIARELADSRQRQAAPTKIPAPASAAPQRQSSSAPSGAPQGRYYNDGGFNLTPAEAAAQARSKVRHY